MQSTSAPKPWLRNKTVAELYPEVCELLTKDLQPSADPISVVNLLSALQASEYDNIYVIMTLMSY